MKNRQLQRLIPARRVTDGAGVTIYRSIGLDGSTRVDPFLMLDEFCSDKADDYIGGFPEHPHRGFETVTYMLAGHMLHQDHMGNEGHLRAGDVQWMTAGSGIIHSEMPQQQAGLMRGFQLWINLPAATKMQPPSYADISAEAIPLYVRDDGLSVKVIAGDFTIDGNTITGPAIAPATEPLYWDIYLPAHTALTVSVPDNHHAVIYVYEGELLMGADKRQIPHRHAGVLTLGENLNIEAGVLPVRCIVLAAKPLKEPVAQWGPFVMTTAAEVEQAIADYHSGELVKV